MTRLQQRRFYHTPAWRNASRACRARAGWLCERCKAEGFTEAARLAHHKTPLDAGGSKFGGRNGDGLEAICYRHHQEVHDRTPNLQRQAWSQYLSHLRKTI